MDEVATKQEDKKPTQPCSNCHGRKFWNKGWGWLCQRCHPCPDDNGAEFYEVKENEK